MKNPLVLIVDDEPDICELVELTLSRMDIDCVAAPSVKSAKQKLSENKFILCLTDMRLPDGDGHELVEHIQKNYSSLPVAVITAFGNVEGAVNTLKAGAFDYVSKPIEINILRGLVKTALTMSRQQQNLSTPQQFLLGKSPQINELRNTLSKLARSQAPVFISGESGTGKELVARLIHQQGPRASQPFIAVNCGAIPTELMESEFFGHKKGSFTGAVADKQGLFQAAHGGTLFFDEIADLPLMMQVKLLRAIQEKAVRAIGDQREIATDVRILSASHRDLQHMVATSAFRQDLFYRINVITVNVPSLRERQEDIPLLIDHILKKISVSYDHQPELTEPALAQLCAYAFPGNVRELENILERAVTLCDGEKIRPSDLQLPKKQEMSAAKSEDENMDDFIDTQQREIIVQALERNKWNRTAAAKDLGISSRQLRYRLKKFDIE